jgi:FAD/FMN-containing dehydrogenase
MSEGLLAALRDAIGEEAVFTDPGVLAAHEVDWTGRFRGKAVALLRPASSAQVGEVLLACARAGVGVVPQGGNTGLVAGAVPYDTVVLSTSRLNAIGDVDRETREVTAGAGATLERVQRAAADAGLDFGVDLAARGSATIGGMIATDAGGIHGLRYGSMRRQVVALEAAVADGSVVRELPGRDLVDVVAGSEGTLAVITQARLRLIPFLPERATALVSVGSIANAVAATTHAKATLPDLEAVELVDARCLELMGARAPFEGPAVLMEIAGNRPMLDELTAAISAMPGLRDAVVADDGPGRRRLWALREGVTEAIAAVGVPHKLDVGMPLGKLAEFVDALPVILNGSQLFVFGHLAVGNVHVNLIGPAPDDERVDDAVLRLVARMGGQVAAEHGIGRAKARWLTLARSPGELAAHGAVKHDLDPRGVLNPGVLEGDPIDGLQGNSDTMTRN